MAVEEGTGENDMRKRPVSRACGQAGKAVGTTDEDKFVRIVVRAGEG